MSSSESWRLTTFMAKVWPSVFHVNLVRHERGDLRPFWGLSYRSSPSFLLWRDVPPEQVVVATANGDDLSETFLKSYLVHKYRVVEIRPTIRVYRSVPRRNLAPLRRADRPTGGPTTAGSGDNPERAVAARRLVGGEREPGEREDLRRVGHESIIGVAADLEQFFEPLIVERQFPAFSEFGQFSPEPREAGTMQRTTGGERQIDRLNMRRKIDAPPLRPECEEVGHPLAAEFRRRSLLQFRPARVDQFTEVARGRAFPVPLRPEGVVENPGDLGGERFLECPFRSPHGKRQPHETPLSSRPSLTTGGTGNGRGLQIGTDISDDGTDRQVGTGFAGTVGVFCE